jgi:hypothetical protein
VAGESKFEVEILAPEGEVFGGEVSQVSTRTAGGETGLLANRAPLLAALRLAELRLYEGSPEGSPWEGYPALPTPRSSPMSQRRRLDRLLGED